MMYGAAAAPPTRSVSLAAPGGLRISVKVQHAQVCRIDIGGELDLATVPDLTAVIQRVSAGDGRVLILDVSGLTFCDCAGLRALLIQHRRLRDGGGALAIVYPPLLLRRLIAAAGLGGQFALWPRHVN